MPRDSRIAAREAAAIPFPRLETTPPVTNTYLVISAKLSVKAGVYRKPAKPTNCSGLRELGPAAEVLQRLRIGQRLEIFRLSAMNDVAHRQFDDLAALGTGNVGHLDDLRGHVPGRGVAANLRFYLVDDFFIQIQTFL